MQAMLRSGLVLAFLSIVTACGEDGGTDPSGGVFEEGMAWDAGEWAYWLPEQAVELLSGEEDPLDDAPAFAGKAARRSTRALPSSALPRFSRATMSSTLQAAIDQGCTVTASGTGEGPWDPYDGNHNGLPDDYHVKMECFHVTDSITNATFQQRREIRAKERAGEDFGLDLTESYLNRWEIDGELDEESKGDRTLRMSRNELHGTIDWTANYRNSTGGESPSWYSDREEAHGELDAEEFSGPAVRRPAGPTASRDIPYGQFHFTGRIEYTESEGYGYAFDLSTPIPLQVDGECAWDIGQVFTGGVLLARFYGDADRGFGISFNNCGDGSNMHIFGDEDELPSSKPFAPRRR
jgi:hypothetical protein